MVERAEDLPLEHFVCGFCLERWSDHSPGERISCEADLQAIEARKEYERAD